VCDRGFVSGDGPAGVFVRQKSNDVCFTVGGEPVIPPPVKAPAEPGNISLPGGDQPEISAPEPQRLAQGEAPPPERPTQLPHTGDASRLLLLLAGIQLTLGGAAIIGPRGRCSLKASRPLP
jgi:LPXTG-motif cell wall-anchored protein